MSSRFFVETLIAGDHCQLTGAESHHLTRVMRAQRGNEIVLFDGSGLEFIGRISAIAKDRVELTIIERRETNRELKHSVTLAVALPKGDRQKVLIEKLVELGVTRLIPLITERGVAQPIDSALERLSRSVIEASKQCGRNRLMEISPPLKIDGLIRSTSDKALRLVAHPGDKPLADLSVSSTDIFAAVGPEGGFTDDEVSAFDDAGWNRISLGARILRIETAAIALAAWASLR